MDRCRIQRKHIELQLIFINASALKRPFMETNKCSPRFIMNSTNVFMINQTLSFVLQKQMEMSDLAGKKHSILLIKSRTEVYRDKSHNNTVSDK